MVRDARSGAVRNLKVEDNRTRENHLHARLIGVFWLFFVVQTSLGLPVPPGLYPLLYVLVAGAGILTVFTAQPRRWNITGLVLYYLFFLMALASLIWTPMHLYDDVNQRMVIYAFGALAALQLATVQDRRFLFRMMLVAAVIVAFFILFKAFTLGAGAYRGGTAVNPNYLSLNIAAGLIVALPMAIEAQGNNMRRIAIVGVILLCAYTLLILASRGAIAATAAVVLLSVMRYARSFRQGLAVFLGTGVATYLLANSPAVTNLINRFSESRLSTLNDRTPLWQAALREINSRDMITYLFGSGTGSSSLIVHNVNSQLTNMHNTYVQVFTELGLLGLLLLSAILFACLTFTGQENSRDGFTVQLLLVASGIIALTGTSTDLFQWWIIIGLGLASPLLEKRRPLSSEQEDVVVPYA